MLKIKMLNARCNKPCLCTSILSMMPTISSCSLTNITLSFSIILSILTGSKLFFYTIAKDTYKQHIRQILISMAILRCRFIIPDSAAFRHQAILLIHELLMGFVNEKNGECYANRYRQCHSIHVL